MQSKGKDYTLGFRMKVAKEYLEGDASGRQLARKYNLSASLPCIWAKRYGGSSTLEDSENRILTGMKRKGITRKEGEDTQAYIRRLERSLEEAEDKAMLLQRVIEISEEELGITLPKKPTTKQSKK